jgi:hypothetical protein
MPASNATVSQITIAIYDYFDGVAVPTPHETPVPERTDDRISGRLVTRM